MTFKPGSHNPIKASQEMRRRMMILPEVPAMQNESGPWPSCEEDVCPTCGYTAEEWRGEAACSDNWHYFRGKVAPATKEE